MERNPEQDPKPSFDTWLTQLHDEEIERLTRAAEQPFTGHVYDPLALAEATELAWHFLGDQPLDENESVGALVSFGMQLAIERMVRDGDLAKAGEYTLTSDEEGATLTLTEQGKRKMPPKNTETS